MTPSTIPQLAAMIDDEEDSAVSLEAMWDAMELGRRPATIATSAIATRYYADLDQTARKSLFDRWRRRSGLPSMEEVEARERAEAAAERARRVAAHNRGEMVLKVMPGGALVDVGAAEVEADRDRQRAEALRRRREAEIADRAAEVAAKRENEQARVAEVRRQVPPGIPPP